jgi:hypothetical protein
MDTIPDVTVFIDEAILEERKRVNQFEQLVADKIAGARAVGWTSVHIDTTEIRDEVVRKITTHLKEDKGYLYWNTATPGFTVSWDPHSIFAVEAAIAKQAKTAKSGTITVNCASLVDVAYIVRYYTKKGHAVHIPDGSTDVLVSWPAVIKT